ncbi:hypothetical protein CDD83_3118 [Cordyceps sp. RAO-2017]|nr:hypothetical protein CDD83_3118 [Cordyceps sp. RAO-2017]
MRPLEFAVPLLLLLLPCVAQSACKPVPGDSNWPPRRVWKQLNQTVGGRLMATVPLGSVCHPGGYGPRRPEPINETACGILRDQWPFPPVFSASPADVMNAYFQNASCSPFYDTNGRCRLGNLASYSIAVSEAQHVIAGVQFARDNNVRLAIKNTGHDFMGKSTGKGSLSLWMHNLNRREIIHNYTSSAYSGAALRMGAGTTGDQALSFATAAGYVLVTGDCPTVGVAVGYASGGGHGLLNNVHGMGADNVLEWEVVTADGRHLTASPDQNADLYWALTGGGAGTFAVVLSVTYRLHPDVSVGAATLSFSRDFAPSKQAYENAVQAWWLFLPTVVDAGAAPAFNLMPDQFLVHNTTGPNMTAAAMNALYAPYLAQLDQLGVSYDFATYTSPNFLEHFNATNGPLPDGPYTASPLFNSRIIPLTVSQDASRARNLTLAMMAVMDYDPSGANWQFGCQGVNVGDKNKRFTHPDNALAAYWRNAIAICLEYSLYDWDLPQSEMLRRKQDLANIIHPPIVAATIDSGSYLNEADPLVYPMDQPSKWKDAFYGANYNRLRSVKDKWDPQSVFYARTSVGSEDWTQDSEGRLCKA